jgi:hypothetical protein
MFHLQLAAIFKWFEIGPIFFVFSNSFQIPPIIIMVLAALRDSCVCVVLFVGMDGNCNFSAMRSLIELKLGGDLGLVSQMFWFQGSFVFHIVNKQT